MCRSKINIFCIIQVFILTICNCYDNVHYSSVCEGEQISLKVAFEHPFSGTIFAKGYSGNPNCSSPNMEVSSSFTVSLNLSFLDCNTMIKRVEEDEYTQAINTIIIQFNPLIESDRDFELMVNCDIDYLLSREFFRSYLIRDLRPPKPIKSKLNIMSGEELLGNKISGKYEVGKKQFIVLNVEDEGKYNELRIRKCFAHATLVIDQITPPDLLLDDNRCFREPILKSLHLKANELNSDLRDFSEIQNFEISFMQESFYVTCAFDLCLKKCEYDCTDKTEIRKSHWSFIQTHEIRLFDRSFKESKNRNVDLRTSMKMLSHRFLKIKELRKNTKISNQRKPILDELADEANINAVMAVEKTSTIYSAEISRNMLQLNKTQDVRKYTSENFIKGVNLNSSKTEKPKRVIRRSVSKEGISYSDDIGDTPSPKLKITDLSDKSITPTVDSAKSETFNNYKSIKISPLNANSFKFENTDAKTFSQSPTVNEYSSNYKIADTNTPEEISTSNPDYSTLENTDANTFDKSIIINADSPNYKSVNVDLLDKISTTNINSHTLKIVNTDSSDYKTANTDVSDKDRTTNAHTHTKVNTNNADKSRTTNASSSKTIYTDASVKINTTNANFSNFENIYNDTLYKSSITNALSSKLETPVANISDKISTNNGDSDNFKTIDVHTSGKTSYPNYETANTYVSGEIKLDFSDFMRLETADTDALDNISINAANSRKLENDADQSDKPAKFVSDIDCFNKSCKSDEAVVSDKFSKLLNATRCFNSSNRPGEDSSIEDLSFKLINGTDFYNISYRPEVSSESFNTNGVSSEDDSSLTSGSSKFNSTLNDEVIATKKSVSYLKYAAVASSLGVLIVSLTFLVLYLLCYIRKLKREQITFPKNVYNHDYQL